MKNSLDWKIILGIALVFLSAVVYYIHFLIFRDAHHIFIYLIGDIGFVFLEVLLVTLIIHRLLVHKEKQAIFNKLNMVIGAFFSEVGTKLLRQFAEFDPEVDRIKKSLVVTENWSDRDFDRVRKHVRQLEADLAIKKGDLRQVKELLVSKRQFLLNLLENPNLLEHESFTSLLWAVFHLGDELSHRADVANLPDADYEHLAGDIKRAYRRLVLQWLSYIQHLKHDYPYLFSLALRTNPFDADASVQIKQKN